MRVIAGEARGRPLVAPPGRTTRPTSDRVREALFSMLHDEVSGSRVLDLYAGSGALGIEALSRGAREAVFVERGAAAQRCIRLNLERCGFAERARVLRDDAVRALQRLAEDGERFDLIFLDPPYASGELERCWPFLPGVVSEGALVVAELARRGTAPEGGERLALWRRREYGDTAVCLYRAAGIAAQAGN
ncbi:MAG: 16S rRNA (guanine(966)-N(2))-methyltransferase RsmD [Clostridia bacterium]|nr:16S rRNA (guanine(966)-N(2))-methyltransferase RsmD [Clostridia bacterium]